MSFVVGAGLSSIDKVRWNKPVRLVNPTPVAELLETGQIMLRPVNRLSPDVSVVSYLK